MDDTINITIVETRAFTRKVTVLLSEEEYAALQIFLRAQPDAGDVIQRTGGARKVRWKKKGKGKRGGFRVIYFYHDANNMLWMLDMYEKSDQEDLSENDKKSSKTANRRYQIMSKTKDLLSIDLEEELTAIRKYKAGKGGLREFKFEAPSDAATIRHRLGLTQEAFAALMGVSVQTLRNWEQGLREPRGPAKALLRIVEKHPQVLFG